MSKKYVILLMIVAAFLNGCFGDKNPVETNSVTRDSIPGSYAVLRKMTMGGAVKGIVTPEKGLELFSRDVRVIIPPGAVTEPVEISMDFLASHDGLVYIENANVGNRGVLRLQPSMSFMKPVTIESSYDRKFEGKKELLYTWFWRADGCFWERIERVGLDPSRNLIVSRTNHFSDFINSTLEMPESPEVSAMDETSLKNLEASKGDAGMPDPLNIQAGNKGAEGVNIPIQVPGGVNGMQPRLAVRWIKEGNTWLGQGFDLSVGSIGIDGRFGLPDYDYSKDEMRYTLDGEILERVSARAVIPAEYIPQRERGSFNRIRRYGSGKNCYFEVTGKNGRKRIFGSNTNSREKGFDGYTYRWHLCEERDSYGNWIKYEYKTDNGLLYPLKITWGSSSSSDPLYCVEFTTEAGRKDIVTSGRSRRLTKQTQLLKKITVKNMTDNGSPVIRSCVLEYYGSGDSFAAYNIFKKSYLKRFVFNDKNGSEMYSYDFEYNDVEKAGTSDYKLFDNNVVTLDNLNKYNLGFSSSNSGTFGGSIGVGAGIIEISSGLPLIRANVSAGGNATLTESKTHNFVKDMDGNGLIDLVRIENGAVWVKRNLGNGLFSRDEVMLNNLPHIDLESVSSSFSGNVSGSCIVTVVGVNGSFSFNSGNSTGQQQFTDVNGDGLIDYIDGEEGEIYIQKENLNFELFSSGNHISFERTLTKQEQDERDEAQKLIYKKYEKRDAIIKWEAPYSGHLSLENKAHYVNDGDDSGKYSLYIFHNKIFMGKQELTQDTRINQGDWDLEFDIKKGDSLYFIAASDNESLGSHIVWNRKINYQNHIMLHENIGKLDNYGVPSALPLSITQSSLPDYFYKVENDNQNNNTNNTQSTYYCYSIGQDLITITPEEYRNAYVNYKNYILAQVIAKEYIETAAGSSTNPANTVDPFEPVESVFTNRDGLYHLDLSSAFFVEMAEYQDELKDDPEDDRKVELIDKINIKLKTLSEVSEYLSNNSNKLFTSRMYKDPAGDIVPVFYDNDSHKYYSRKAYYNTKSLNLKENSTSEYTWGDFSIKKSGEEFIVYNNSGEYFRMDIEKQWTLDNKSKYDDSVDSLDIKGEFNTDNNFVRYNSSDYEGDGGGLSAFLDETLDSFSIPQSLYYSLKDSQSGAYLQYKVIKNSDGKITSVNNNSGTLIKICDDDCEDHDDTDDCYLSDDFQNDYPGVDEPDNSVYFYKIDNRVLKRKGKDLFLWCSDNNKWQNVNAASLYTAKSSNLQGEEIVLLIEKRGNKLLIHYSEEKIFDSKTTHIESSVNNQTSVNHTALTADGPINFSEDLELSYNSYDDFSKDNVDKRGEASFLFADIEHFSGGYKNWYYGHIKHLMNKDDFKEDLLVFNLPDDMEQEDDVSEYEGYKDEDKDAKEARAKENTTSKEDLKSSSSDGPEHLPYFHVYRGYQAGTEIKEVPVYKPSESGELEKSGETETQEIVNHTGIKGWYLKTADYKDRAVFHGIQDHDAINPQRVGIFLHKEEFNSQFCSALMFSKSSGEGLNGGVMITVSPVNPSASQAISKNETMKNILNLDGRNTPSIIESINASWSINPVFNTLIPSEQDQGVFKPTEIKGITGALSITRSCNNGTSIGVSKPSIPQGGLEGYSGPAISTSTFVPIKPASESITPTLAPSAGLSTSHTDSFSKRMLIDINGDGLTDILDTAGDYEVPGLSTSEAFSTTVRYNTGANFSDSKVLGNIKTGQSQTGEDISMNVGASIGIQTSIVTISPSINVGAGGGSSSSCSDLIDINSDGLPDKVTQEGDILRVRFNYGDGFSDTPVSFHMPSNCNYQESLSGNFSGGGGVAVAVGGRFWIFGTPLFAAVDVSTSINGSWSTSSSSTKSMLVPFSGNGAADLIVSNVEYQEYDDDTRPDSNLENDRTPGPQNTTSNVKMYKNILGKAGLLSHIETPRGTSIELLYKRYGHTTNNPQGRWEVSEIKIEDPYREKLYGSNYKNGYLFHRKFDYARGYYDRTRKMFYGYEEVTSIELASDGYSPGKESINYYNNTNYQKSGLLEESVTKSRGLSLEMKRIINDYDFYETSFDRREMVLLSNKTTLVYDESGTSLTTYEVYTYQHDSFGSPVTYSIERSGMNKLEMLLTYEHLRDKWILGLPVSIVVQSNDGSTLRKQERTYNPWGRISTISPFSDDVHSTLTEYNYDTYGHLSSIITPSGYSVQLDYDSYGLFPTRTTDSLGLYTEQKWDYSFQVPLESTDANNSTFTYQYDNRGRLRKLYTPYDIESDPYMSVEYFPRTALNPAWKAVTRTKISKDPADKSTIATATFTDALGRTFQVQKDAIVYNTAMKKSEPGVIVSSFIEYDQWGQQKKVYEPFFKKQNPGNYSYYKAPQVIEPNGEYYYTENFYNDRGEVIKTRLPDGNTILNSLKFVDSKIKKSVTDPSGLIVDSYSNMGGQTERIIKHSEEYGEITTRYKYDSLGQLLEVTDTEGNVTSMTYDLLGQKLSVESPVGGLLEWTYNDAGQVISHQNPVLRKAQKEIYYKYDQTRLVKVDYPDKTDLEYFYGEEGSLYNNGRLIKVTGEFGSEEYSYGKMGEMREETHTFRYDLESREKVFTTSREYNYLGQITHQKNFDGRETDYLYDSVGQVAGITTSRNGYSQNIVTDAGYNLYGQRSYLEYGNGTETTYEYDPARRWMESFSIDSAYNGNLQQMEYTFDDCVGNISSFTKGGKDFVGVDGIYYDRYRIELSFEYDSLHQLVRATGSYDRADSADYKKRVYTQNFSYDTLGRMTGKSSSHIKEMIGGEERAVSDFQLNYDLDYHYDTQWVYRATQIGDSYYQYDANGNTVSVSPEPFSNSELSGTIAPAITTINSHTYVMGGLLSDAQEPEDDNLTEQYFWDEENKLKESNTGEYNCLYRYGPDGERMYKRTNDSEQNFYIDENQQYYIQNEPGNNEKITSHFYIAGQRVASLVQKGTGAKYDSHAEQTLYWYHPDHLGTASLITDHEGLPYERLEYTPFGEVWNKETDDDILNYIEFGFTGQREDKETGLLAFPHRYYNARTSRWLSLDPMGAELLASEPGSLEALNWFSYCENNPIKYVDPEGMRILNVTSSQYQNVGVNRNTYVGTRKTYDFWGGGFKLNTLGLGGCLFTAGVNIGNSFNNSVNLKNGSNNISSNVSPYLSGQYTNTPKSAASLAHSDRYFSFIKTGELFGAGGNSDFFMYPAEDFSTSAAQMENLLFDMTGVNWNVDAMWGDNAHQYIKDIAESSDNNAYIIGWLTNGHKVNVKGIENRNAEGEFDPSKIILKTVDPTRYREGPREVTLQELGGIYALKPIEGNNE